jgi:hypothetical protein
MTRITIEEPNMKYDVTCQDAKTKLYSSFTFKTQKQALKMFGLMLNDLNRGELCQVLMTDDQGNVFLRATNQ